eukprot:jgi/Botrbrau1/6118/Bobra.331_2s0013.1
MGITTLLTSQSSTSCCKVHKVSTVPIFEHFLTHHHTMSHHKANPSDYGWTYQGSNEQSRVDFYQRDGVKMDYYYTTGTTKTSMNHPTQGNTQMFRQNLSEQAFRDVCNNPRSHTGQGYQTTANKPK